MKLIASETYLPVDLLSLLRSLSKKPPNTNKDVLYELVRLGGHLLMIHARYKVKIVFFYYL